MTMEEEDSSSQFGTSPSSSEPDVLLDDDVMPWEGEGASGEETDSDSGSEHEHNLFLSVELDEEYHRKVKKKAVKSLRKPMPPYGPSIPLLLMRREHGYLSSRSTRNRGSKPVEGGIETQMYASRYFVERMARSHSLQGHPDCVLSLDFNTNGSLLASSSVDHIFIWDWARKQKKLAFQTMHEDEIVHAKFVPLSGTLDIVSCDLGGQVCYTTFPPSGSNAKTFSKELFRLLGVNRLVLTPNVPHELFAVGLYREVMRYDFREDKAEQVFSISRRDNMYDLRCISHHPYKQEFCVAGNDRYVRVYDKRNYRKPVWMMCPLELDVTNDTLQKPVRGVVYSYNGNDILAAYMDDYIFMFNNQEYIRGHYSHKYEGNHNFMPNCVHFFGPRSEYIISGSDCGKIFYWEKETEAIVNARNGNLRRGCDIALELHPSTPLVASSGKDDINIWMPSSKPYSPNMKNLARRIEHNFHRNDGTFMPGIYDDDD